VSLDPRTPVLVGAGVAQRRFEDPREALEAADLMAEALRFAAEDAGSPRLLSEADSVRVPRGFWKYPDPGQLVADRIGAKRARSVLLEIGVSQQTLLTGACLAIAAGRERVAIVTGGEAKYRSQRASILGVQVPDTQQPPSEPDEVLRPEGPLWADLEWDRGLMMPVHYFSLMENALRFHQGLSLDAHRDEIARIWSGMSDVAASNPHAWGPVSVPAAQIRDASPKNRMIAFPYTRLHNSNWNVDQAAGLLLCSVQAARELGVPEERWVFPLAASESNHMQPVSCRPEIHDPASVRIGARRILELAGRPAADIEHLELYSCFPAPVRLFARALGVPFDRRVTETGGMAFAGGPLNNFVLQAVARMAEVLRADRGSMGLVTTVSGMLNKCGFGLWSTAPGDGGFRFADVSEEVAAASPSKQLVPDHRGSATVASYTVLYAGHEPAKTIAVCDLADGCRTVAQSEDAALVHASLESELCGRTVEIAADGRITRVESA
jgi:acetyl-CoA C-acetyltransferase